MFVKNAGFTFSQVKNQSVCSSTMLPGKVNKNNSSAGANKTLDKGKENAMRKLTVNQKSLKTREQNHQRKDDKAGIAALIILVFQLNFTIVLFCSIFERILF
jgi:hypothetical protein